MTATGTRFRVRNGEGATPEMWAAYEKDRSTRMLSEIIAAEDNLVGVCATAMRRKVPVRFRRPEIESWAREGLMEAVQRFDPHRGFHFRNFALAVMARAVINGVRQAGWEGSHERQERRREAGLEEGTVVAAGSLAEGVLERIADNTEAPTAHLTRATAAIQRWVARLGPEEREIVTLAYLDGLTTEEIAKRLGRSTGYVSTRRQRALAQFDPGAPRVEAEPAGFPGLLAELRRGRGWSQRRLAEELGVSRQLVGEWERGQLIPTAAGMVRLAGVLEVDLTRLLIAAASA